MSATLGNLLRACKVIREMELQPSGTGAFFVNCLANYKRWDQARSMYYGERQSRALFDWITQSRSILSFFPQFEPCSLDNAPFTRDEWAELERRAGAMSATEHVQDDYLLDRIDTWLLESYSLKGVCEVEPGDVVLDCGTYSGNTSLYFAKKAGPAGHVYGFEGSPETFAKYARNMREQKNVTPVQSVVGDICGQVRFLDHEYASRVGDGGIAVNSTTIDQFCLERKLSGVDFIKMDIEGHEAKALRGAAQTIRRFRPKMALSAYHINHDLTSLPKLVLDLCPDYSFRLRHFSQTDCETVLFCIPKAAAPTLTGRPLEEAPPQDGPGATWNNLFDGMVYLLAANAMSNAVQGAKNAALEKNRASERQDHLREYGELAEKCASLLAQVEGLQLENRALRKILQGK